MIWCGQSFIKFCKSFLNLIKLVSTRTSSSARVRDTTAYSASEVRLDHKGVSSRLNIEGISAMLPLEALMVRPTRTRVLGSRRAAGARLVLGAASTTHAAGLHDAMQRQPPAETHTIYRRCSPCLPPRYTALTPWPLLNPPSEHQTRWTGRARPSPAEMWRQAGTCWRRCRS